jgi:hypothetical protein
MAKPPGPGKCVHCLAEVAERDWDHVLPISWYPDTTPPDLEKWKIPSCLPCNHGYSKIEGDFRDRVGLCLDPDNPASKSIVEAAMRSIDAEKGRDPCDAAMCGDNHDLGSTGLSLFQAAVQTRHR